MANLSVLVAPGTVQSSSSEVASYIQEGAIGAKEQGYFTEAHVAKAKLVFELEWARLQLEKRKTEQKEAARRPRPNMATPWEERRPGWFNMCEVLWDSRQRRAMTMVR